VRARQPPTMRSRHIHRLPASLVPIATSALAIMLASLLGRRWRQPAIVMPSWVLGIGGVCALLRDGGRLIGP
jgi:hypothetical protein